MAIVENFWLKKSKKRLAGAVLYQAMGQTRSRELASSVANPRTESQMNQRVKWANPVAFYRANASWMKYAFETKAENQTEYNKFMSLNVGNTNVYFTRQMAAAGACVVLPYIITQGSLPSVEVVKDSDTYLTNIYIGEMEGLYEDTLIGAFSQAVIENNPGCRAGDQLSFIRLTQMTNAVTGVPYIIVRKYELILDPSSTIKMGEMWPMSIVGVSQLDQENVLCVDETGLSGGFAIILSRTSGGKTFVSTQSVILVNMQATISAYSSQAALQAAIDSYGSSADAFLSASSAAPAVSGPVGVSLLGISINGTEYANGAQAMPASTFEGEDVLIKFNSPVDTFELSGASMLLGNDNTYSGSLSHDSEVDENLIFHVSSINPNDATVRVQKITVNVGGMDFIMNFTQPSAGGGGMD